MWVVLWIVLALALGVIGAYYRYVAPQLRSYKQVTHALQQEYGSAVVENAKEVLPYFLGMHGPTRLLVLLQNNTELRPTGGFLGNYAIIEMDRTSVTSWFVEGSEQLDARANVAAIPLSPAPLRNYLAQPRYYFRDSNWLPDFPSSAQLLMQRYAQESGDTKPFDGVVAINADFVARAMRILGPITADGVRLDPETFVEQVQWEVEYGYAARGDSYENRKEFMRHVMAVVFDRVKKNFTVLWPQFAQMFFEGLDTKEVQLYAQDAGVQKTILSQRWGGIMAQPEPGIDAWFLVDANLASLKTDRVLARDVQYSVTREGRATLRVTYKNRGVFDWRTTRYRSFSRVYLPAGTTFIEGSGAMVREKDVAKGDFYVGREYNRPVVGFFFAVEPGATHTVELQYQLPEAVVTRLQQHAYELQIQKQSGTPPMPVDMRILDAEPVSVLLTRDFVFRSQKVK